MRHCHGDHRAPIDRQRVASVLYARRALDHSLADVAVDTHHHGQTGRRIAVECAAHCRARIGVDHHRTRARGHVLRIRAQLEGLVAVRQHVALDRRVTRHRTSGAQSNLIGRTCCSD